MKLFRKVDILGTRYSVYRVASGENEYMEKLHYGGLCTTIDHRIYILDLSTTEGWGGETEEVRKSMEACTLRHEVIHAFLNESGLQWNSFAPENAWAKTKKWWTGLQFRHRKSSKSIRNWGVLGELR